MSENDFHDQVLAALSDLNVDLAETNGELKAVVARMDKHAAAIAQHQTGLYPHPHHHSQEGPDALQVAGLARVPREFIGFLVGKRAQDHIELLDISSRRTRKSTSPKAKSPWPATGGRWPWSMRLN